MRVKFKKGDPRAGMVVELDPAAAKRAIAAGEAEEVSGNTSRTLADKRAEETGLGTQSGTSNTSKEAGGSTGDTASTSTSTGGTTAARSPAPAKPATKKASRSK